MVTERQKTIFEALVREYVDTATPITSGELVKKYRLPYSPATVRAEFSELDREGLISQPHTSAGRIPTDKGYRFFIENSASGRDAGQKKLEESFRPLCKIDNEFDFLRQASRLLAHFSQEFGMAGFPSRGLLYKSGLAEVLAGPEFLEENSTQEFGALVDFLDEELEQHFMGDINEPQVFIGDENPIREARNYTLMISQSVTPFGERGIFAILGPRRMNYEKNLSILRAMGHLLNEY